MRLNYIYLARIRLRAKTTFMPNSYFTTGIIKPLSLQKLNNFQLRVCDKSDLPIYEIQV